MRDLAQLVGPRGRVVGVDVSGAMIAEAKKRHATSELPVEFVEGDADLTFPEASFDRCRTERMLMHLDDPEKALAEMVRVVRRVARSWCSTSTGTPCSSIVRTRNNAQDRARVQRRHQTRLDRAQPAPPVPRAGLTEVTCVPHAVRPYCAFAHRLFDGHLAKAQQAGVLTADELTSWWHHLEQAEAAGQFHLGILGFVVGGRKP